MNVPLQKADFSLDVSGIAAFFGGEESFAAMSSVHLIRWRRYLAWYNSPGSYFVAKKYGTIPRTRMWRGIYPAEINGAEKILGLDGQVGSRYIGTQSRTTLHTTGHLAYLLETHCQELESTPYMNKTPQSDYNLTVVEFNNSIAPFGDGKPVALPSMSTLDVIAAISTILLNLAAAFIPLLLWHDWACFAAICMGMICNGISCLVLSSGRLELRGRADKLSQYCPAGDGIIGGARGKGMILLKGPESVVSDLTNGKYQLSYASAPNHHRIGFASFLLTIQAFVQLVIVPQATLIGQISFLATLAVSWLYNAYLASMDREKLQTEILLTVLGNPTFKKYSFPKWSSAVTASAFYLQPVNGRAYLDQLIPNDTPPWLRWKECVVAGVTWNRSPRMVRPQTSHLPLNAEEEGLLQDALENANIGHEWFVDTYTPTFPSPPATTNVYGLTAPGRIGRR